MNTSGVHPLRAIRQRHDLSIDDLARHTGLSARTILRAEMGRAIYPSSRRLLREFLTNLLGRPVSSHELGLMEDASAAAEREEGETEEMRRRTFLQNALLAASVALPGIDIDRLVHVFLHPASLDDASLKELEAVIQVCWQMSNESRITELESVLPVYLPQIVTLAHQPTKRQRKAAHLASQAYILNAEIDRGSTNTMKAYCRQAVFYSEIAENDDIHAAALKQQATIFLVAKQPDKALAVYQETLPLLQRVSPLLRSRVYLGLASASARCNQTPEAVRYLGLAREHFPRHPEDDPNYLYTVCDEPVLYLYEALTYADLKQPGDAWQSLLKVDGLNPKMSVPENTRIEFINLQAKIAAQLGNMEQGIAHLIASAQATTNYGYDLQESEAYDTYQEIAAIWPQEQRVKDLQELFI